jgi:uncharacterized protein (TIGR03083 family)
VTLTADDLDLAVSAVSAGLRPATGADWTVPAGTLDWDCWHTAEHIGDCLLSYAGQLVAQPDGRYVRFLAKADEAASAAEVLEFAEVGGRILVATLRSAPATMRAYHPSGMADPTGFAGMGCVETLLHGEDIAQGLGVVLDPPRDLCQRVLDRMFPHVQTEDLDLWDALRWYTGRLRIVDRPAPAQWRWTSVAMDISPGS